jgi:hypothetical protein
MSLSPPHFCGVVDPEEERPHVLVCFPFCPRQILNKTHSFLGLRGPRFNRVAFSVDLPISATGG